MFYHPKTRRVGIHAELTPTMRMVVDRDFNIAVLAKTFDIISIIKDLIICLVCVHIELTKFSFFICSWNFNKIPLDTLLYFLYVKRKV